MRWMQFIVRELRARGAYGITPGAPGALGETRCVPPAVHPGRLHSARSSDQYRYNNGLALGVVVSQAKVKYGAEPLFKMELDQARDRPA